MGSRVLHYAITVVIGLALASQYLLYSVTPVTGPFIFFTFIVLPTTWFLGWEREFWHPPGKADLEKLKRVVFDLCKNGVDAMPDREHLTLLDHADQSHVCFEIQDTGVGIPEGQNISDAFATFKREGWDLGCTIVLSDRPRITVELNDTRAGIGTTF